MGLPKLERCGADLRTHLYCNEHGRWAQGAICAKDRKEVCRTGAQTELIKVKNPALIPAPGDKMEKEVPVGYTTAYCEVDPEGYGSLIGFDDVGWKCPYDNGDVYNNREELYVD